MADPISFKDSDLNRNATFDKLLHQKYFSHSYRGFGIFFKTF